MPNNFDPELALKLNRARRKESRIVLAAAAAPAVPKAAAPKPGAPKSTEKIKPKQAPPRAQAPTVEDGRVSDYDQRAKALARDRVEDGKKKLTKEEKRKKKKAQKKYGTQEFSPAAQWGYWGLVFLSVIGDIVDILAYVLAVPTGGAGYVATIIVDVIVDSILFYFLGLGKKQIRAQKNTLIRIVTYISADLVPGVEVLPFRTWGTLDAFKVRLKAAGEKGRTYLWIIRFMQILNPILLIGAIITPILGKIGGAVQTVAAKGLDVTVGTVYRATIGGKKKKK